MPFPSSHFGPRPAPPPPRCISDRELDEFSEIIDSELDQIKKWAKENERDATADKRNFWMLKLPAIIGGLGASALEAFNLGWAVIIAGFITSVCVAIDGLHPRGGLYNVHKRAANELYRLQDRFINKFNQLRIRSYSKENPHDFNGKRKIEIISLLEEIQKEKDRINEYITSAEASLGNQAKQDK